MCEKAEVATKTFKRDILDYRLLNYLQRQILPTLPNKTAFKTLATCNNIILTTPYGQTPDVQVMKSDQGKAAKFWGIGHCGNTFYCPVCETHNMAKHALKIGAAIDGLKEKKNKVAFMLTLTVIHHNRMKCEDLVEILFDAWKRFKGGLGVKGKNKNHTMLKFCREFKCTDYVRAFEITYSTSKGWNPHFHCLFWVDKKRLQKVAKWEQTMRTTWRTVLANAWAKHFANQPGHADTHDKKTSTDYWQGVFNRLHTFAAKKAKIGKASQRNVDASGLWISKTKTGKIRQAVSSNYIAGWGSDRELTGKPRKEASGENSRTMYQLLDDASKGDELAKEKYIEFMQTMKAHHHRRVMYSKTLVKFIREYTANKEYKAEVLKKTLSDRPTWYSLISICPKDWRKILQLERENDLHLRTDILYLAANYDAEKAFMLIYNHLLFFDINLTRNPSMWSKFSENLFNEKAFDEALEAEREMEAKWHKYDAA